MAPKAKQAGAAPKPSKGAPSKGAAKGGKKAKAKKPSINIDALAETVDAALAATESEQTVATNGSSGNSAPSTGDPFLDRLQIAEARDAEEQAKLSKVT